MKNSTARNFGEFRCYPNRNTKVFLCPFYQKEMEVARKMAKITVECESRSLDERLNAAERVLRAFLRYLVRITPDEQKLRKVYRILKQAGERRTM